MQAHFASNHKSEAVYYYYAVQNKQIKTKGLHKVCFLLRNSLLISPSVLVRYTMVIFTLTGETENGMLFLARPHFQQPI